MGKRNAAHAAPAACFFSRFAVALVAAGSATVLWSGRWSAPAPRGEGMSAPSIELGAPAVVARAPLGFRGWGFWQFPAASWLKNGRLQVSYGLAKDWVTAFGALRGHAVSSDGGLTWTEEEETPETAGGSYFRTILLPNGDRLRPVELKSLVLSKLKLPAPRKEMHISWGAGTLQIWAAKDLPSELRGGWRFVRQRPGSEEWVEESAAVNIPGEVCSGGRKQDRFVRDSLNRMRVAPDGSLWGIQEARRIVDGEFQEKYRILLLRSTDSGHTWNLLSEIPYEPDPSADPKWALRDGFTEPSVTVLPDGSVFCLMRTDDGNGRGPLYWSRSTDGAKTWSKPQVFDEFGVKPELVTLANGVTLATYGRPGVWVRGTNDRSGLRWGPRIAMLESSSDRAYQDTCGNNDVIAYDDHRALLVYSDFYYPDERGRKRKTILARMVTAYPHPDREK